MKVKALIICGEEKWRLVTIPCGLGKNSIKWLGNACSQRYSEEIPSSLRVQKIVQSDRILDPGALIESVLADGDEITAILEAEVLLDSAGTPLSNVYQSSAYSAQMFTSEQGHEENQSESREEMKSKIDFVRTTMNQQMLNWNELGHLVASFWPQVIAFFPRVSPEDEHILKELCIRNILVLEELFLDYSKGGYFMQSAFQSFLEDAGIFNKKTAAATTSRVFVFAKSDNSELTLATFVVALLLVSQIRHNDTYEKNREILNPSGCFSLLIQKYIRPLAEKRLYECLVREAFSSPEFLVQLHPLRKDLFALFEKAERTDYSTLSLALMHILLVDSKLILGSESKTRKLLQQTQKGYIYGRSKAAEQIIRKIDDRFNPGNSEMEEVFFFPEFVEAICRASYTKVTEGAPPAEKRSLTDIFIAGLQKALNSSVTKLNPERDNRSTFSKKRT